ncbi:sensor histidine kinase [Anaerocolumna sp. MB42-C2]|uniref:sensor histidine kinase n=1 Tax=Anaerocolumna sp. MB42-C2 TaxID=3070997 RepID=UPI0027E18553|nr:HAMP domain-containing sensor histidine kinase [Anaerocolumna sp. MB42-C2]WMJ85870.1 HAMP domain-containing sensor histidine kinase [Anaerocolumna sp. MB42-C2]
MIFTSLLWAFMLLIYFSAKNNKINQWCAITIFIFSFGTFKEYIYYDLSPVLSDRFPVINKNLLENLYSVMTAILYNLVMPCSLIFALYFSSFHRKNIKLFHEIRNFCFLPGIILFLIYNPAKTSYYQHNSRIFWYVVTVYNITFGILMTIFMIGSIHRAESPLQKRQKKLISLIILPPVWYWLITIFVIHSLQITALFKIWKQNAFILSVSILFYIVLAFKEGIMGLRLQSQNYQWDSDMKVASKGASYTSHILKNEIAKIEWCLNNLSQTYQDSPPEELAIIERSANHLKQFVKKTQIYSDDIILRKETVPLLKLITDSVLSIKKTTGGGIDCQIDCEENQFINCDTAHMSEVLNNLLLNAADAMNNRGTISIKCYKNKRNRMLTISITDEGTGIKKEHIHKLFHPYFTTKKTNCHFGLGLSYCYNVMNKHKGYIDIQTEEGKGSTFSLYLPME